MARRLLLSPDEKSYRLQDGASSVSVQHDGPAGRYRAGPLAPVRIPATWTLNAIQYEYLRAFFLLTGARGLPFTVPLIVDTGELVDCEAHIVPDTWELAGQSGELYQVVAELEVTPPTLSEAAAQAVVDAYPGSS